VFVDLLKMSSAHDRALCDGIRIHIILIQYDTKQFCHEDVSLEADQGANLLTEQSKLNDEMKIKKKSPSFLSRVDFSKFLKCV